jgi:dihydrofolate reductase
MKIIYATSADGFIARSSNDDMKWTGHFDKNIFALLTRVHDQPIGMSRNTRELAGNLPNHCVTITRHPDKNQTGTGSFRNEMTLENFRHYWPNGWLGGGPAIWLDALERHWVRQVIVCRLDRNAFPVFDKGIKDPVLPFLKSCQDGLSPVHVFPCFQSMGMNIEVWQ